MNINRIAIKNFKSLRDIEIKLSNLTLITGVNSSGKSSFIEVVLLFIKANQGNLILANPQNFLFQESPHENIYLSCNNLTINFKDKDNPSINWKSEDLNLFADDFQYVNTNRVTPKESYNTSSEHIKKDLIGEKGEYTAHYLNKNKNSPISIDGLKHKKAKTRRLIENVSLWLGEISYGIEIGTNLSSNIVTLHYIYNYNNKKTNQYTPLNVGFGVTYVLPIIVAILKAKKGDLVIIENPESHLHPAGQSKVAELCAIASANGVQIIVETHSDHFLNGIRVATKKALLTPEQSKIYYFRKDRDELETKIDEINIDKEGGIDKYPKGFFDQMDEDLDKLISW